MAVADPDLYRSASHSNMLAHLCGPFLGGATDRSISVDAAGHLDTLARPRYGLLLAAPAKPLSALAMRLTARLDGAATDLPSLVFYPYTEAGAFLPVFWPASADIDAATGTSPAFAMTLSLSTFDPTGGAPTAIPANQVAGLVTLRLVEGNLGRLIYLLGAEKQRLRRMGRELAAMRLLSLARGDALDRFGADLGVPRFADQIQFDKVKKEIVTPTLVDGAGKPIAESDADYRRRLGVYRSFLMANRTNVLQMLNGAGADADPNAGPLGQLGLQKRFLLNEDATEFAIAIKLVGSPGSAPQANFATFVASNYLIFPNNAAAANQTHQLRFIPSETRAAVESLRTELRSAFTFGDTMGIAPALADAMRTLARAMAALDVKGAIKVLRAQDAKAGSRYELGLGVDIAPLAAAQLDHMVELFKNPARKKVDADTEAVLASMTPVASGKDPDGQWLFEACGFRTVHRIDGKTLYLSHFPTQGLEVTALAANADGSVPLQALYQASGDTGVNAALQRALAASLPLWTAAGGAAWTVLSDADSRTHWNAAPANAPAPAVTTFQAAGLPAVAKPSTVVPQLLLQPPELLRSLQLDAALAGQIIAGAPAAATSLRTLAGILAAQGVASVLPLVTGAAEVLLIVSVVGLPQAGVNLSDRRATGFRWYVVPLSPGNASGFKIKTVGSRSVISFPPSSPANPALAAVVVVGYARDPEHPDPYEVRVDLPDKVTLNLAQYEFLMNLLQQICPTGVQINTYSVRQQHVDLDGDGVADPLPPSISRTFRQFRRDRQRGETGVNLS